tara:strand:- start:8184 stop:8669 length:486 start_codon:yes stop_codon:yes gene_type:complete
MRMTLGFPNSLILLLCGTAIGLCSCKTTSSPVAITKVNPYFLESSSHIETVDRMVEFERRRYLYGTVTSAERHDIMGQYYSIFWETTSKNPATVRLEYRQGGSGSTVLMKEVYEANPKRKNVTKFEVIGDEFWDGGKVSQWKASVIENGEVVADYQSFLWK